MQRIEIEIPLPPHPKQRPRAGKGRSVFKPAKSRAFEKEVALHVKGQLLGRPPITGPVRVSIECSKHGAKLVIEELPASKKSKLRGDVDNYQIVSGRHEQDRISRRQAGRGTGRDEGLIQT